MARADSSFQITSVEHNDDVILVDVILHEKDELFEGHFPDNPIMPGVLNIEIIEKILSEVMQMQVKRINQVKFLSPIVPKEDELLKYRFEITEKPDGRTIATIQGKKEEVVFVKVQLEIEPKE